LITPLTDPSWSQQTPEDLFAAWAHEPTLFWLDSGNSNLGWSYLGIRPVHLSRSALLKLSAIPRLKHNRPVHQVDTPPFRGGWIINLNYPENTFSNASAHAVVRSCLQARFYENIFAFSHYQRRWFHLTNFVTSLSSKIRRDKAKNSILFSQIREKNSFSNENAQKNIAPVLHFTKKNYLISTEKALNYIRAGDIYQINLAQCFSVPWTSASELYLRMRHESPAAYGAYLGSGLTSEGHAICCISPEMFLRTRSGQVETRPIKGTRPRGTSLSETLAARRELESSEKERAELNMIVDLERNDLGRVCTYGSVHVDSSGDIEELPTLLHRTASVTGRLRPGTTVGGLLAATFPGGSITGAPKRRAMEIISELESVPRGPYCGAIGWVGVDGNLDLNIAIRTAVCDQKKGEARYFAGAGIVADSDPEKEYDETLLKAAAFFRAVGAR